MKKVHLLLWACGAILFPAGAARALDVTAGTEAGLEKRENGDTVVLPAAYFLLSGTRFPSESLSFFADAAGRANWDYLEKRSFYDFTLSGKTSLRTERFFWGLDVESRIADAYDGAREWRSSAGGNFSYNHPDFSLFVKPAFALSMKDENSFEVSIEPGVTLFLFSSLVSTLSLSVSTTSYEDGSREYGFDPRLFFDWYPSVPFNVSLRGGYSRTYESGGSLLSEEYRGETSLLCQPAGGLSLKGGVSAESIHYRSSDSWEHTLKPGGEIRFDFTRGALSGTAFILSAGEKLTRYSGDSAWTSSWYVRMGVERDF